jgi:hypothetical protein
MSGRAQRRRQSFALRSGDRQPEEGLGLGRSPGVVYDPPSGLTAPTTGSPPATPESSDLTLRRTALCRAVDRTRVRTANTPAPGPA